MTDFNTSVVVTTPGDASIQLQSTNNPGSVLNLDAVTSNHGTEAQLQFQQKFSLVALPNGPAVLVAKADGSVQLGPYAMNHPNAPGRLTISGPGDQRLVILSTNANGDPVGSQTQLLSVVSNSVNESQLQFVENFSLVPLGAPNGAGPAATYNYNENTGAWEFLLKDNPTKSAFVFNSQSMTFPDGTVQTTAFPPAQIIALNQAIGALEAQIAQLQAEINAIELRVP